MSENRLLALGSLVLVLPWASFGEGIPDHPLISRFPGSTVSQWVTNPVKEFDEIAIPTGPYLKGKFTKTEHLEGKITRLIYNNPDGRSTLEIYRSYQQALAKAGFQTLFACSYTECGDALNDPVPDFGYWCVTNKIQCPEPMRYIAVKLPRPSGDVYVAVKVRTGETYLNVAEIKPMAAGSIKVDATALASDIVQTGHASVYGIYFDTGKSELKPESDAALAEISKLLTANSGLKLHVVGHTDNVGTLTSNMSLSKQRADAVVAALTSKYHVAASRMDSAGVGPLAPIGSNKTEDGRAKNRRVELVEQ